jgi:hypothetical protein
MSSEEEREEHKQVTQAVAQQPQEEFISADNQPSKDESEIAEPGAQNAPPPRRES